MRRSQSAKKEIIPQDMAEPTMTCAYHDMVFTLHAYTHTHTYIYIYVCVSVRVSSYLYIIIYRQMLVSCDTKKNDGT